MRNLGEEIKRIRTEKGLYQEALAEATGLTRSTVSRIESGRIRPSLETVAAISRLLKSPELLQIACAGCPCTEMAQ